MNIGVSPAILFIVKLQVVSASPPPPTYSKVRHNPECHQQYAPPRVVLRTPSDSVPSH